MNTPEDDKAEALVRAATERGYAVEQGTKNPQRPWQSHWIVRTREGALYGDPDSLLQRIEGQRDRRGVGESAESGSALREIA
jgi:hypothetical protein